MESLPDAVRLIPAGIEKLTLISVSLVAWAYSAVTFAVPLSFNLYTFATKKINSALTPIGNRLKL